MDGARGSINVMYIRHSINILIYCHLFVSGEVWIGVTGMGHVVYDEQQLFMRCVCARACACERANTLTHNLLIHSFGKSDRKGETNGAMCW